MNQPNLQQDSPAWIIFVWISFISAMSMMAFGIWNMPVDWWIRGYLYMGLLFLVGSTFTLSKTLRDKHEADKLINRVVDAKTERILSEYELKKAV